MAKKIKFPLKMADGSQVRNIEELREHFDLTAVLSYYTSGRLAEWLTDRYYDVEAEKIKALEPSAKEFKKNLCEILAVPYSETGADDVDLANIAVKNERYERLKQFTADDTILAAVDLVAFTQEDLADLLDKDATLIYLCGERFRIPCSKGSVTYIGINNPIVEVDKRYNKEGIVFKYVQGANILDESINSVYTSDPDSFEDLPNDMVKKAAENGNSHAQLELASRYDVRKRYPRILNNPEQAKYWYKKVIAQWEEDAKNGDIAAQVALANSFAYGDNGAEINIEKSEYWSKSAFEGFQKSFVKGNVDLQFYLDNIYDFCDDDTQEVIQFFERPAKQGNLEAMQALIELYGYDDEGFCNDDFYDKEKAEYWQKEYDTAEFIRCKKAAEQGNASEQSTLGDYYAEGKGTDADSDKADFWYKLSLTGFKKAAEQGDARAQMEVARCYHDGKGVKVDKQTAFLWNKKAADQENNQAMKIVGDCYATGDGVEQSDEECLYWYRKAAEQGNQEAASQLRFKKAVVNKSISCKDISKGDVVTSLTASKDTKETLHTNESAKVENAALRRFIRKNKDDNYEKCINEPFSMIVDTVSELYPGAIVVKGVIEKGIVQINDEITITKKNGAALQSVVKGVELFSKLLNYAEAGDEVGLLLKDIKHIDISKGDVV